jgi:hypothetical protein
MSFRKKNSDSTVEHFTGKDMDVSVSQPREGFFCTLAMKARVPLPPDEVGLFNHPPTQSDGGGSSFCFSGHWKSTETNHPSFPSYHHYSLTHALTRSLTHPSQVFEILTNPDNVGIFRSVKKVLHRKVVFDSGGFVQAEVEHLAIWKLGFLKGTFKIKLLVEQNEPERTIRFRLAGAKGFMKDFTGGWKIHPYPYTPSSTISLPPASITTTDTPPPTSTHWHEQHKDHHRHGPLHVIHGAFRHLEGHLFQNSNYRHHHQNGNVVAAVPPMKPETSVVELEQSMAPAIIPPAPLAGIIRKISAAQIRHIMEDLRKEADRRIEEREGRIVIEVRGRGGRGKKKKKKNDNDGDGSGLAEHIKELDD